MNKYWCWWLHRYLYLVEVKNEMYIMEDIADARFRFTKEQFDKLERR